MTTVRLLLAQDRAGAAVTLLDPLLAAAQQAGRDGSVIEILVVQALARQAAGDRDGAVASLVRALEAGVPVGYARLFLDEGAPMDEMLGRALNLGLATAQIAALRPAAVTAPGAPAEHDLSERELDVLRLLGTELTGPQIAGRLFVSVNTLRTHTRHIFTKLDVTTRAAAVRRGTELGLL